MDLLHKLARYPWIKGNLEKIQGKQGISHLQRDSGLYCVRVPPYINIHMASCKGFRHPTCNHDNQKIDVPSCLTFPINLLITSTGSDITTIQLSL